MGYQFLHVEAYSRQAGKGKAGGRNVREIIAEAGRETGNTSHITNPQTPNLLYGKKLHEVEQESFAWAEQAKDAQGRKLRKDGHCLLAGVISLPSDMAQDWNSFKKSSIAFLKSKYGENLRCVVEHLDESHPHIHFYAVPSAGNSFDSIHQGQKAAKNAKLEGKVKGEQNSAYIASMRDLQDEFSLKVAQNFGLTRIGPGRRRLTRSQWKAEQQQAQALRSVKKNAQKYVAHYKKKGLKEAQEQKISAGKNIGYLLDGFKNSWHLPSKKAKREADEKLKKANEIEQKSMAIQKKRDQIYKNQIEALQQKLAKQTTISNNLQLENKELKKEIKETNVASIDKRKQPQIN